jgi:23S rRNA pseudouridine2605 synthase
MQERIQKIIANCGLCSRRKAEDLIRQLKVTVNGRPALIGDKADVDRDRILVEGRPLRLPPKRYLLLNKPIGVETTLKSESGKPTVISLTGVRERLIPAGRLDVDSSGLVILTNDGELANRIMHPRYPIDKVYFVKVRDIVPEDKLEILRKGVKLDDGFVTSPADVKVTKIASKTTWINMKLSEGKKRQIRRMFDAIGFKILDLQRTRIGNLTPKGLKPGAHRDLKRKEVNELKRMLGML